MDIRLIKCTGDYAITPHDPYGNIKGFHFILSVLMLVPNWIEELKVQYFKIDISDMSFECDGYIRAYKIDIVTRLISEITISTTGEVKVKYV